MSLLTRFSLKNPIAVIIISVIILAGGIYALTSLKVELLPNIDLPSLSVQAAYPGASPQDVDREVTSKLDRKLKSLSGLKKMTSQSMNGFALIQLEFPVNTDMDKMKQTVTDQLSGVNLPNNVTPKLSSFSFSSLPVLNFAVFAKNGTDLQTVATDDLKPQLEKIEGVSKVDIGGVPSHYVDVVVDRTKAEEAHLTLQQISKTIQQSFVSVPAGSITSGDVVIPVRVDEKLNTVEALKALDLNQNAGAAVSAAASPAKVTLGDIAAIKPVTSKDEWIRYNLKDSLSISVLKKQDANTVQIADKVIHTMDQYHGKLDYQIVFDQSSGIKKSVNSLEREGLFGALFASLAVLLFLRNIRATIIAVLSIPLSLLVASVCLSRVNITLNMMTLGGMAVAVGRVVDDSIVVIENIFRRLRTNAENMNKTEITFQATKEMISAITASTLTTIVVFLPLGFVGGIIGKFFMPFALTVVFSLIASLLVAVTLVPVLARYAFARLRYTERTGVLQRKYASLLLGALRHKVLTLFIALVVLLLSCSALFIKNPGFVFLQNQKQHMVMASIHLPAAASLHKTNAVSLQIEKKLANEKSLTASVFAQVGALDYSSGIHKANEAQYFIRLADGSNVDNDIKKLKSALNAIVHQNVSQGSVSVQEMSSGGAPANNNIEVDLYSTDEAKLQQAATAITQHLQQDDRLKDVTSNYKRLQSQWTVHIDPAKAQRYGVSAYTVLSMISDMTRPVQVGSYVLNDKAQNIELTYNRPLTSVRELNQLTLPSAKGPIQLQNIANVRQEKVVTQIQRLNGKMYASVSAVVNAKDVQGVSKQVIDDVKTIKLPDGVDLGTASGSTDTANSFKQMGYAILVAIGLVYIVMLVTFGKARIPFIILSSLLFIPIGAILGIYLANQPVSISTMIGLLMLIGIVVTNAIVLVDRVGQNRILGMDVREALVEAGMTRLRPILMTAFATICALLPLAFTEAEGSLISKGLAVVVIGGLLTATLLTLIIVPVVYELFFHRLYRKERRLALRRSDAHLNVYKD